MIPHVSVIVPVYNAEKYLKQCLKSITNQTLKEIEIICVDDASIDNSLDIIKDFSKKDNRIKYYEMPTNSGSGLARNKGMEHATGEYISFIDSDDFIIDNTAYEKLYQCAATKNANIISANLKIYRKDKIEIPDPKTEIKNEKIILPQDYGIPWYFGKNLFKKQFLIENKIKFPNYKRGQDPVFLAKALKNVDIIYCLPINFYGYRYPYKNSLFKVNNTNIERDYINHFRDVFELLSETKFTEICLEYRKHMYNFFINLKFRSSSKSLEKNIKSVFGENSEVLMIHELKCSLLEKDNTLKKLQSSLSKKDNTIQKIMSSNSWKLTNPLRKIGNKLRKSS